MLVWLTVMCSWFMCKSLLNKPRGTAGTDMAEHTVLSKCVEVARVK